MMLVSISQSIVLVQKIQLGKWEVSQSLCLILVNDGCCHF